MMHCVMQNVIYDNKCIDIHCFFVNINTQTNRDIKICKEFLEREKNL